MAGIAATPPTGGGSTELAYQKHEAIYTSTGVPYEDVPGFAITVDETEDDYKVKAVITSLSGSVASRNYAVAITDPDNNILNSVSFFHGTANVGLPVSVEHRVSTTGPGTSKTYKVRIAGANTGIPKVNHTATSYGSITATTVV